MHINLIHAIILGIIQGATEFLPISSSGHLVIFQHLFGINLEAGPIVAFDVCLHIGTLFAVLAALRKEVAVIIKGIFKTKSQAADVKTEELAGGFSSSQGRHMLWLIIVGTIPAVIIGFAFKDFFEHLFTTVLPVGIALITTGCILFATRFIKKNEIKLSRMRWWHAIAVGLAQAFAIIPGISRSGATISMGLFTKLDRQLAAKFSFLLSVIAIGGAAVLEWESLQFITQVNLVAVILGTLFAFISGYICVRWMLAIVRKAHFSWFAYYCWAVGLLVIFISFF